ncbi:MAG TPA: universal stress protein, partial [Deltaproteobacteria bacterium]|nr:universal stress protein [Deltaproteobacteria bacterium]
TQVDLVYLVGNDSETSGQRDALNALLQDLPEAVRGRARIESMEPAQGLVDLSGGYDLMVVGSREPPALERLLKGPMATRVLRKTLCPVLVPRGELPPGPGARFIVGVDVSGPDPERILQLSAVWAERFSGTLDALYVDAGGLPHISDRSVREAAEREWAALRAPKIARLRAMMERVVPEGCRGGTILRRGEPEDVLVQLSTEYDVLLVGNRDREGLARFVLGAVAAQVVRRASCDVLSLPTAADDLWAAEDSAHDR